MARFEQALSNLQQIASLMPAYGAAAGVAPGSGSKASVKQLLRSAAQLARSGDEDALALAQAIANQLILNPKRSHG